MNDLLRAVLFYSKLSEICWCADFLINVPTFVHFCFSFRSCNAREVITSPPVDWELENNDKWSFCIKLFIINEDFFSKVCWNCFLVLLSDSWSDFCVAVLNFSHKICMLSLTLSDAKGFNVLNDSKGNSSENAHSGCLWNPWREKTAVFK